MRSSTSHRFAVLSVLAVLNAAAQSPGTFVAAGSMTTVRSISHTATLLKDGRVLIAGGISGAGSVLANAELYDPSTGAFTATSDLTAPRRDHTAALLPDGRVLIVGGTSSALEEDYPVYAATAELYDPATGTFTATGNDAGAAGTANLLSNGKVLITGRDSVEFYDPQTGIFTSAGPVNKGSGSVVLLRDGRVVILNNNGISLYDVTGEGLKLVANSPGNGSGSVASTGLGNGKVLISGGFGGGPGVFTGEASLYDPRSRTLENTGLLMVSRGWHSATLLPGGRVLLAGGVTGTFGPGSSILKSAEVYDPVTRSFTSTGSMTFARALHTATLLHDGRVLMIGRLPELYIPELRAASAASLSGPLAPESLGSVFGSRLALATEVANDPLSSLPTTLGGISLRIRDSSGSVRLAPLLYVSPSQINFEVPAGTAPGNVTLEVVNAPAQLPAVAAEVKSVAPGLFAFDDNTAAAYALRIEPDGTRTVLSVRNTIVLDDRPVYLVLYATGVRNRSSLSNVQVTIGATSVPAEYAGPEGSGVPGLDQVNVRLTSALKGIGVANLVLVVDGTPSNIVSVDVR